MSEVIDTTTSVKNAVKLALLPGQIKFLASHKREVAMSGGLGSGKSFGQGAKVLQFADMNAGHPHAIVSKSHKQLYDAFLPEIMKFLNLAQVPFRMKDGNKLIVRYGVETVFHLWLANNKAYLNWPGFNLAGGIIDEWDTFAEPQEALEYLNDRIRIDCGLPQTAITSSPEGYGAMFKRFKKALDEDPSLKDKFELIYASTFDNPHLRSGYIMDQIASRDPRQAMAYLYGQFISRSGQSVYYRYIPSYEDGNWTHKTLADFSPDAEIHWGMDFNANLNPAIGHIVENGIAYAIKQYYGMHSIDDVIKAIKRDFNGRKMWFYPDALNFEAVEMLKREFGKHFVIYTPGNPRVMKAVASLGMKIQNPKTEVRGYLVNPTECPQLDDCLQHQQYNEKEEPDKKGGFDHSNDAARYFVHHKFPYVERQQPRIIAV